MINVCIIESHRSEFIDDCIASLRNNTEVACNIKIFQEGQSREDTLNTILSEMRGVDIVVAADDIVFTKGWDRALLANWKEDRILGFSMTYPGGEIVQDRGYRLISIDGIVRSEAIDRGLGVAATTPFEFEPRTSMTGCFQAIPALVSGQLGEFPSEGCNRLGELLYHSLAIRKGIEVGVVGHFLEHHARSTKSNPNSRLSSESYLFEKGLWEKASRDFRLHELTSCDVTRSIESGLREWLSSPGLIYGAGTITEFLAQKSDIKLHHLCSGLREEADMKLLGKRISYKDDIDWLVVERVLIAVEGKELAIARDLRKFAPSINIHAVKIRRTPCAHYYDAVEVK